MDVSDVPYGKLSLFFFGIGFTSFLLFLQVLLFLFPCNRANLSKNRKTKDTTNNILSKQKTEKKPINPKKKKDRE